MKRVLSSSQVVVFLIGCPVIILLGFFWFVVKCFHKYLGATEWKGVSETYSMARIEFVSVLEI